MKKIVIHPVFFLIILVLSPVVAVYASSPADSVHFCLPFDYEQWRHDHPRPAAKRLENSPEFIVRAFYYRTANRPLPENDMDIVIDKMLKGVQRFFADEMERHGYGRKTFRLETDTTGKVVVHHFVAEGSDKVPSTWEIKEQLGIDGSNNLIHFIWLDFKNKAGVRALGASGLGSGRSFSGFASIRKDWDLAGRFEEWGLGYDYMLTFNTVAHELGHALGLPHDFRPDPPGGFLMSYSDSFQISPCAAEWLDAHRYFNTTQTYSDQPSTIDMLPPESSPNGIRIRFHVTDPDGLHQAQLEGRFSVDTRGWTLLDCQSLNGVNETIEFVTTEYPLFDFPIALSVMDMYGSFTFKKFDFSDFDIATLLPPSEVVSIPDPALVAAIREALDLPHGHALTSLDMQKLGVISAPNRQISDLTGLEQATNLRYAKFNHNQIEDLTPLAGSTRLRSLFVRDNLVRDVSPLTGIATSLRVIEVDWDFPLSQLHELMRQNPYLRIYNVLKAFSVDHNVPGGWRFAKLSGDNQAGKLGVVLAEPFVVEVRDQNGAAFAGATVIFAVASGDGTLSAMVATTDTDGRAATMLTLGNNPGPTTVAAYFGLLPPVVFSASAPQVPNPDFDGDGIVGFADFLVFVAQFGLSQGTTGYDARFDLDGDGVIGFADFLVFVNAFGKEAA